MANEKQSRVNQSEEARRARVETLRQKTHKKLPSLSVSQLNSDNLVGNIENFIGTAQFPIGTAGPLKILFQGAEENIYGAFCTTEGALVSSIARGTLAINLSGGCKTRLIENTVSRAPVFLFHDLDRALHFSTWVKTQITDLKKKTTEHSKFAQLLNVEAHVIVHDVHLLFTYSTGDAAGQNMTTFITASLVQTLKQNYFTAHSIWTEHTLIEGNLSSDKKATSSLYKLGRGRKVISDVTLPAAVAKKVLKVSTYELCKNFNRMKSARVLAGYSGYNINVANAVAALFLSTGQDAACIHESSQAELHMEMQGDQLFVSLYMPSILVGTVGGGTHLPHAHTCLALMNCEGEGSANKLAQVICAYALALEISTVSAIESGHFVQAHSSLGRDSHKKINPEAIDTDFINRLLPKNSQKLIQIHSLQSLASDDAMMMDLANISARRICGLYKLEGTFENTQKILKRSVTKKSSSQKSKKNLILKIKAQDSDLITSSQLMLENLSMGDVVQCKEFKLYHPLLHTQSNEVYLNQFLKEKNWDFVPQVYASIMDKGSGIILIAEVAKATKNFSDWTKKEIEQALKNISTIHKSKLKKSESKPFIHFENDFYKNSFPLWKKITEHLIIKNSSVEPELVTILEDAIENYKQHFSPFEVLEKRLCHLDYNPRNILFDKKNSQSIIDWEFSALHLPQRDLIEFFLFQDVEKMNSLISTTLQNYPKIIQYNVQDWQAGMPAAFFDFVLRRLNLYLIIAEFKNITFLPKLIQNTVNFYRNYIKK